jgi:hypothetical protein
MPSPFPGVDPYIESSGRWGDFHGSMIAEMRTALNARLPEGYAAEIDLYVWFHEPAASDRQRGGEPDVYVTSAGRASRARRPAGSGALSDYRKFAFPSVSRRRHKYVRIVDLASNRVVTVIELLSPSNKASREDRDAYLIKRNETLAAGASLVEIDLLRGGPKLPLSNPPPAVDNFYVLVCRAWEHPEFALRSFGLRDPLPILPVPLDAGVPDAMLPLGPCADAAFDGGKYRTRLPYEEPLRPRLQKEDAVWVRDLLRSKGLGDPSPLRNKRGRHTSSGEST